VCGICGIVRLEHEPESDTAREMLAELKHRGPDGEGFFSALGVAFGHARLAIIDLSDGGRQPFESEDGTLQLMHNGEIFNYIELRAELERAGHRFRTATDTEVVLAAYEQWGDSCVQRFNGMWAFAIWDDRRQRLFCSRDRFGIKPFYYRWNGGRLSFASEPRAFRRDPQTILAPNLIAVRDFLEQGYTDHMSETFFASILQLPAAHSLVVDKVGLHIERYWELRPAPELADHVGAFRELFVDSVRLRLRSDVPLGTALSGGLDSSAVAVAIDHLLRTERWSAGPVGDRQETFTAYFEGPAYDERTYADAVARRIASRPHFVTFDDQELVDVLPQVVESQGEPFGSSSIVAQWFVMREARRAGLKVMLDGQGGDEILAGYPTITWSYYLADLVAAGRMITALREARAAGLGSRAFVEALVTPFLPEDVRRRLRPRRRRQDLLVHPRLRGIERPSPPERSSLFADRLRTRYHTVLAQLGLPELLRYEDRNTMAHSLEGRVPFLDHRLVELAYGLPAAELVRNGMTKVILREALRDLLPDEVRARRDKLGFVTPEPRFLAGALGDFGRHLLGSTQARERSFVNVEEMLRRLEAHRRGASVGSELWRAMSVELWARSYLD
jgi:asparagine synthase (glutamine-hydrolysing)